jgi:hypothetical protein
MKNKFRVLVMVAAVMAFGMTLAACDTGVGSGSGNGNGNGSGSGGVTLTGYSKSDNFSESSVASRSLARLASDDTYDSSAYRSFPIDNQGQSVRTREITVDAILQFERDVPGYDEDSDGYVGYYNNHSSYPSLASTTGEEGVYLVFDSRDPSERYQVDYHHINLPIADSNLEFFENLILKGDPISIFHVDSIIGPTCWVISWKSESSGGISGSPF